MAQETGNRAGIIDTEVRETFGDLTRFDGKTVLVTGGASGIGLETVRCLAGLGATVAILDLAKDDVDTQVDSLRADGYEAFGCVADITDSTAVTEAFESVLQRTGSLDGLVANAGIRMRSRPVVDLKHVVWDNLIRVNLTGTFLTCQAAARIMCAQRSGSIVTVASLSAHDARVNQSAYCVSKAGVVQFSRVLALELAQMGVRVNAVCPGTTATAMFTTALEQEGESIIRDRIEGSLSAMRGGIPLRRVADPIDPAAAIVFLLSEAARHITGQSLLVDGGESLV